MSPGELVLEYQEYEAPPKVCQAGTDTEQTPNAIALVESKSTLKVVG